MAEEDYSDLGEVKLRHYDGSRWCRSPGVSTLPYPYGRAFAPRPAEAEDIVGKARPKTGLYYSPPGTSYTIVEQPSSVHQNKYRPKVSTMPQVTVPEVSRSTDCSNKKRPISPEQVLKLFSSSTNTKSVPAKPSVDIQPYRPPPTPDINQLPVKTISMCRNTPSNNNNNHGFGICVKGDSKKPESVGVYISMVEEGSIAEKSGLKPGDSILEVNGIPFTNISHEEALKILKSCRQISMTIRTSPLTHRQRCGLDGWIVRQKYSWMDRTGRTVSPPPDYSKVTPTAATDHWPPSRMSKEKVRKIELNIEPGQTLGLMIRGGLEYNLGIFVTGVDKDSVADRAGVQIGDQILDVNGMSYLDITHDDAVNHLKRQKRMTLTIRDVGKIPHSFSSCETESSDSHTRIHARIPRTETIQMVEEKASSVLKKSEFATLCYYLEEYCSKRMSCDTFIAVLFDLLNTPEKFTLMTELREVVIPQDRSRFDDIVYRRHSLDNNISKSYSNSRTRLKGENPRKNSPTLPNIPPPQSHAKVTKFLNEQSTVPCYQDDGFRSPSEDSGLGLGPPDLGNGRSTGARNAYAEPGCQSETKYISDRASQASNEEDLGYYHQEYGEYDDILPRGRRRSSLSDGVTRMNNTAANFDDANMICIIPLVQINTKVHGRLTLEDRVIVSPIEQRGGTKYKLLSSPDKWSAQKLGRGCDIKNEKDAKNGVKKDCPENAAHVVPDQNGNLRITVKKTKPLLGIAIEGGANTKHPLPRIINIHENGAAAEAGGLEVGQLILEVDRQCVEGMQHQAVARLIAETYAHRDRKEIEFLVVEAKKSNLEPKPTALIFMDS